ncbi:unnamed protein product [Gadus morhua 'NCC']
MDVGELLNYQPDRGAKRIRDEEGGGEEARGGKQLKGARDLARHRDAALGPGDDPDQEDTSEDRKRILEKLMDSEEEPEGEPVDESSVKKMILTFEKRSYKNQELRIKFPDNPEKFMEAELDLNDIIQEMHVVATMPDLYHLLVELNAVHSLLGLLSHENTDILHHGPPLPPTQTDQGFTSELTDIDTLQESEEGAEVLIDALLEGQVVALLVQNMERLDEQVKEEADGVYNTLAIVENMAEFRPGLCTEAAQQGLMQWLLKRVKAKLPFEANKLYCSEILAIVLQNNDSTRELLGEMDGIDVLLQQLSVFPAPQPSRRRSSEMMENLLTASALCLNAAGNRTGILKGGGSSSCLMASAMFTEVPRDVWALGGQDVEMACSFRGAGTPSYSLEIQWWYIRNRPDWTDSQPWSTNEVSPGEGLPKDATKISVVKVAG